jgi:hypothetical protein
MLLTTLREKESHNSSYCICEEFSAWKVNAVRSLRLCFQWGLTLHWIKTRISFIRNFSKIFHYAIWVIARGNFSGAPVIRAIYYYFFNMREQMDLGIHRGWFTRGDIQFMAFGFQRKKEKRVTLSENRNSKGSRDEIESISHGAERLWRIELITIFFNKSRSYYIARMIDRQQMWRLIWKTFPAGLNHMSINEFGALYHYRST